MATLKNTTINDTGFLQLPVGTTAQRPANPEPGMWRFNTDEGFVEWYDDVGDNWLPTSTFPGVVATGGTVTDIEQDGQLFRVHTFTSVGTSTFDVARGGDVDVLVVAGGGGGGAAFNRVLRLAGGGGSGGAVLQQKEVYSGGFNVTVGNGGSGSTSINANGDNGDNSVFDDITAIGGGGGASTNIPDGSNGGSGGGGSYHESRDRAGNGGSGTEGQGHDGADATTTFSGGGGGAGAEPNDLNGGSGLSFLGSEYARGGDGTDNDFRLDGTSASANTGDGGGGASGGSSRGNGGNGGSGIVIVRYRIGRVS